MKAIAFSPDGNTLAAATFYYLAGMTSGPVTDPEGKPAGSFNSIWRLENDGQWRVVFDKGCP